MPRSHEQFKRFCFILSIVLITAFLLGCSPCCSWGELFRDKDNDTCTVRGTAYINTDNEKTPVPNIDVTIGSHTGKTDDNGFFEITGLKAGTYTIRVFGGDLGWSDKITLIPGETTNLGDVMLHATLPPPDTTTDSDAYPSTAEEVIKEYYTAVNDKDYETAVKYLAGQMSGQNVEQMKISYGEYINSVSVSTITRQEKMDYDGRSIYTVVFSAEYIKHYPAGNGNLPTVHAMKQIDGQWKIVEIGTG